jgi:hypothetical protein
VTIPPCVRHRGHAGGASLLVLVVALAGCAEGRGDGGADGLHREGLQFLEARPEGSVVILDEDKDGYCAPGTIDPQGLCKSFDDCNDHDAAVHPGAVESCANVGVDNDCDGDSAEVDEDEDGKNDLGVLCVTGLPGVCADGKRGCVATTLTCVPDFEVGQKPEACNGKDDNCDGTTDEGASCSNGNTCSGGACGCGTGVGCTGSQQCCASSCVDVTTSVASCGACGVACGANETCDGGACRCGSTLGTPAGGKACAGACISNACSTCSPTLNLAPQATPTSSGGGSVSGYLPVEMNNGTLQSSCKFHWVTASTSTTSGKWIEYSWPSAVIVGSVWFDTSPAAGGTSGSCTLTAGRTLAGGTLQHWTGSAWSTLGTISGKTDDWTYSFAPVLTTKLRLYNLFSSGSAGNPIIFEWRVFYQ